MNSLHHLQANIWSCQKYTAALRNTLISSSQCINILLKYLNWPHISHELVVDVVQVHTPGCEQQDWRRCPNSKLESEPKFLILPDTWHEENSTFRKVFTKNRDFNQEHSLQSWFLKQLLKHYSWATENNCQTLFSSFHFVSVCFCLTGEVNLYTTAVALKRKDCPRCAVVVCRNVLWQVRLENCSIEKMSCKP